MASKPKGASAAAERATEAAQKVAETTGWAPDAADKGLRGNLGGLGSSWEDGRSRRRRKSTKRPENIGAERCSDAVRDARTHLRSLAYRFSCSFPWKERIICAKLSLMEQ